MITGQKMKLSDITNNNKLTVEIQGEISCDLDITCFGLDGERKLSDDRYMIFYNQKTSPENAISMGSSTRNNKEIFEVDFGLLPSEIKNLVFTASIDGNLSMKDLSGIKLLLKDNGKEIADFSLTGSNFQAEKALVLFEVYYKDLWRISAVGKGFNGGLEALLVDFGGEAGLTEAAPVAAPTPVTPSTPVVTQSAPVNTSKVNLDKRIEQEAPKLVSLVKKATVSLEKAGLSDHRAKVALCLDISGSMSSFYRSGEIQAFAERILALGTRFDDDGSIDVFLFGQEAHEAGECTISNYSNYVPNLMKNYRLEGGTYYHKAMNMIRKFYLPTLNSGSKTIKQDIPVYVMFLTDGDTASSVNCEKEVKLSSYEPIFWSFMGIGRGRFTFLEKLDNLKSRYLDNASLMVVESPSKLSEEKLYDEIMKEYKTWVKQAKEKGLIL